MAVGEKYRELVDQRAAYEDVYDLYQIPGVAGPGEVVYRTLELPYNTPRGVGPDPSVAIEVRLTDAYGVELVPTQWLLPIDQTGTLVSGKFQYKFGTADPDDTFISGKITFCQEDAGTYVKILYWGLGSIVIASDVTDICKGDSLLPNVIKPGHLSNTPTDTFNFPGDVDMSGALTVDGSLHLIGNLNISGYIDRSSSDILGVKDFTIRLNASKTSGSPLDDCGIEVLRGSEASSAITWVEAYGKWSIIGGNLDINQEQLLSSRFQLVANQTAEDVIVPSAVDGQMIYRVDLQQNRTFSSEAGVFQSSTIAFNRENYVVGTASAPYTGSTTVFDLPFTYNVGSGQLMVFAGGLLQAAGAGKDYLETDSNTITFNSAQPVGRAVTVVNVKI
jgi:hypothetical protein